MIDTDVVKGRREVGHSNGYGRKYCGFKWMECGDIAAFFMHHAQHCEALANHGSQTDRAPATTGKAGTQYT